MKINQIIILLLMLTLLGIASSQNITPDEIIAGNITAINESNYIYFPPSQMDITPDNITTGTFTTTINESDPVYWYNKGKSLQNESKYNESIEAYDRAIDLNHSYETAWYGKGEALYFLRFHLSSETDIQHTLDEAIKAFDEVIKINQQNGDAWDFKAFALCMSLDTDDLDKCDDCIEACDKTIETKEFDAPGDKSIFEMFRKNAWYAKGMNLKKLGRNSEAMAAFANVDWIPIWMEITTYSQGDGFRTYITLYNKDDSMVRCDGTLRIEIYEDETLLKTKTYSVKREDFEEKTRGLGAFKRDATIWDIGRISYDEIGSGLEDKSLEIRAYFDTPDDRVLKDKTSQYAS